MTACRSPRLPPHQAQEPAGVSHPRSCTRPQLVALMLLSFCVLKIATVIADHVIIAYALAGQQERSAVIR